MAPSYWTIKHVWAYLLSLAGGQFLLITIGRFQQISSVKLSCILAVLFAKERHPIFQNEDRKLWGEYSFKNLFLCSKYVMYLYENIFMKPVTKYNESIPFTNIIKVVSSLKSYCPFSNIISLAYLKKKKNFTLIAYLCVVITK